jgi:hypothetical protein
MEHENEILAVLSYFIIGCFFSMANGRLTDALLWPLIVIVSLGFRAFEIIKGRF